MTDIPHLPTASVSVWTSRDPLAEHCIGVSMVEANDYETKVTAFNLTLARAEELQQLLAAGITKIKEARSAK